MKDIRNLTAKPLRVPLSRGKTLHLGPRNIGQVAASTLDHPPFQEMVEAGQIEVIGEGEPESANPFKEEEPV